MGKQIKPITLNRNDSINWVKNLRVREFEIKYVNNATNI